MMLNESSVLIIENTNEGLTINREDANDFYLSGVAAKFGIKNNNQRVYEAGDYVPHLDYLNEKIARKQLFGEMDHPANFDVTLKNVSHIIEGLSYDPQDNTVKIKVRLLDTPCGRIAKTLVEAGCTVSISSRAAGQVMNEGKVKLQKIFTYDLVAEPGFSEAMLKRGLNESLNNNFDTITESISSLKTKSIVNSLQNVSESYNFGENVKIYKLNNQNSQPQNNNTQMQDFVTKADFQKYSRTLKERFSALSESVKEVKTKGGEIDVNKLAAYTNYLAEELKSTIQYTNYLANMVDNNIKYTEHVAETTNNSIEYADYLSEKLSQNIKYTEYVGEKLNDGLNYAEYLGEKLNQNLNYSEYLGEKMNQGLNYANYLGKQLNETIKYSDYIAEQVNNGIDYMDYLSESVNKSIRYSEYLGENLDKNIAYANYIAEGINESIGTPMKKMATATKGAINESAQAIVETKIDENSSVDAVANAVSALAQTIQSKSANAVLENQYPFLKLMNESHKNVFYGLDSQTKTDVVKVLGTAVWTNEAEIVNLMTAVIEKKSENVPSYIKFMPAKYKEIYESLNEGEKNALSAQAYTVQLHTAYQVKNFWDTRDFRAIRERIYESKNINKTQQQINESQSKEGYVSLVSVMDKQRGYSQSYVDYIQRLAKK